MIDHPLQSCVHFAHTLISFIQTYFEVIVSTTIRAVVDTFTDFAVASTAALEVSDENKIVHKLGFTWVIITNNLAENYVVDKMEFT